jgi:hypothetical protein
LLKTLNIFFGILQKTRGARGAIMLRERIFQTLARRKAEGGEANRVLQPEPHTFPDHRGGVEGVRAARTARADEVTE